MRPDTIDSQPTVLERSPTMRRTLTSFVAAAAATVAGCALDITNPNSPTQESPRDAASRETVGVLATYRANRADQINAFGSYGRETYNMTPQDGRTVTAPYRDWHQTNEF